MRYGQRLRLRVFDREYQNASRAFARGLLLLDLPLEGALALFSRSCPDAEVARKP